MAVDLRGYSKPGPLTSFEPDQLQLADDLPGDPVGICTVAQGLLIQPDEAVAQGLPERRQAERAIRPIHDLIKALSALDPAPLHHPRAPEHRVVGTCRHFATLSTALLRLRGIAARARCGFGTYFISGRNVDHWITEYWLPQDQRWVRIDSEVLGRGIVDHPEDLTPGQFLTGGEAWALHRGGSIDPDTFGVAGVDYAWGVGEIRGNAIRDLASLCKLEMLPWDEWGRMDASYKGLTGPEYDTLMDRVAEACASDEPATISRVYRSEDLAVPRQMIT